MGKLSILGAQRVKALTEILEEKEKQVIRELDVPTLSEIDRMVDSEFDILELREEFEQTLNKTRELARKLSEITGKQIDINQHTYGRSSSTDYVKRKLELTSELKDKKVEEVRQEFKNKRQQLWLCETLEEAKAIVGIE